MPHRLDVDFGKAYSMEEGSDLGIGRTIDQFKTLDYGYLVPIRKIFDASLLRRRAVRWILLFGTLPLVFSWIARKASLNFSDILWLLLIYFCLFWALYFFSLVQPSRENWTRGVLYAVFTATAGGAVLFACHKLPIIRDFYAADIGAMGTMQQLLGFIFIVGVLEECCKALPLLVFGLRQNKIRGVRDGVFLGLMSGFGFAAAEGVSYVLSATARAVNVDAPFQAAAAEAQILTILDRVVSGPLQHGTWAGIVGWFIGVAALRSSDSRLPVIAVGILLAAVMHGTFNTFSSTLFGLLLAAFGYMAFMAYLVHGEEERMSAGGR
jgi:RsiW-degrading membrane proteinase PrsW (M82 family)